MIVDRCLRARVVGAAGRPFAAGGVRLAAGMRAPRSGRGGLLSWYGVGFVGGGWLAGEGRVAAGWQAGCATAASSRGSGFHWLAGKVPGGKVLDKELPLR